MVTQVPCGTVLDELLLELLLDGLLLLLELLLELLLGGGAPQGRTSSRHVSP